MSLDKAELCSSLCSCPLLLQMQENFVKKFKVYPNQGEMVQTTSNFKGFLFQKFEKIFSRHNKGIRASK